MGYPHTPAGVPEWVKGLPRYVYLSLWGGTVGDGEVMSQVSPAGQRWLESLPQRARQINLFNMCQTLRGVRKRWSKGR